MENLIKYIVILTLLLPQSVFANKMLDEFLKQLDTMQGQFKQSLFSEQGNLLEKTQGKMYAQRPNQFRWEYKKPYEQLIVADGEKIWIHDNDLEQVTVKKLSTTLGQTPAFLFSSGENIEKDFFINQLPIEKGLMRFELIPTNAENQFDSMRIDIKDKSLVGLELVDNLGQVTHIIFEQIQNNQKLDKDLFIFTPPAGVDIISE
ncbi:MAG: outer membrane lipoprotein chaperone LolA [Proteobacteria bacterium]|nr:outer membrane lipoprotein chaperone LolA [Pseudomonadota bacterium]